MKPKIILIITVIFITVLFNACKQESTTEPPPDSGENYFPNSNGNYYKYNMERTDSNGTNTTGTRSSTYQGTQIVGGTTSYQVQVDSVTIAGQTIVNFSSFRKSVSDGDKKAGVFYFLDTTGLSAAVPAQYLQFISFDAELRLFAFPINNGDHWTVFKMNLQYGAIGLTLVNVEASFLNKESITLNLASGSITKEALKIRYVFTLSTPDPVSIFPITTKEFDAFLWVVADIGIVKFQGNGTILGAFAGTGIDFADTTTVVSQSLTGFSIK